MLALPSEPDAEPELVLEAVEETGGDVAVEGAGGRVESVDVATGEGLPASLGTASRPPCGLATALGGSEGGLSPCETAPEEGEDGLDPMPMPGVVPVELVALVVTPGLPVEALELLVDALTPPAGGGAGLTLFGPAGSLALAAEEFTSAGPGTELSASAGPLRGVAALGEAPGAVGAGADVAELSAEVVSVEDTGEDAVATDDAMPESLEVVLSRLRLGAADMPDPVAAGLDELTSGVAVGSAAAVRGGSEVATSFGVEESSAARPDEIATM